MADGSLNAWNTVKAAFSDARRGFDIYPMMYLGLMLVFGIQQFLIGPISRKNEADVLPSDAILAIGGIALSIFIIPVAISLVRYFVSGDYSRPYSFSRPFLRILGWSFFLSILASALFISAALGALAIFPVSGVAGVSWIVVCYGVLIWLALRLSTLYPALAMDEPAPILARSFAETKGYIWYILRVILCSLLVFIPLSVAIGAVEYMLFGAEGLELPPGVPDASLPVRLADSVVVGVISGIMTAIWLAIASGIFRTIRDR